jgi:hypothetical protein
MSDTLNNTLNARASTYGSFRDISTMSQDMKSVMTNSKNWNTLSADKKESLEMIVHKIARILNGDPEYVDSWHDIAGYATLISNSLT